MDNWEMDDMPAEPAAPAEAPAEAPAPTAPTFGKGVFVVSLATMVFSAYVLVSVAADGVPATMKNWTCCIENKHEYAKHKCEDGSFGDGADSAAFFATIEAQAWATAVAWIVTVAGIAAVGGTLLVYNGSAPWDLDAVAAVFCVATTGFAIAIIAGIMVIGLGIDLTCVPAASSNSTADEIALLALYRDESPLNFGFTVLYGVLVVLFGGGILIVCCAGGARA